MSGTLFIDGAGAERSSAVSVHSGCTQRRASPCASLDLACNVVATHASAASQTRANSPLPWSLCDNSGAGRVKSNIFT